MHMNRITELNELCRSEYNSLEVLDVGSNKIDKVPIALVHFLPNLTSLNLSNNDLVNLPSLLGLHKNLKNLQVDGNPLKQIRRPIIERGTDAIMMYLKEKFIPG